MLVVGNFCNFFYLEHSFTGQELSQLTFSSSLALTEMRTILARMAWNFDLELDPASCGWLDKQRMFTTWHKTEMRVGLRPRSTPDS